MVQHEELPRRDGQKRKEMQRIEPRKSQDRKIFQRCFAQLDFVRIKPIEDEPGEAKEEIDGPPPFVVEKSKYREERLPFKFKCPQFRPVVEKVLPMPEDD